MNKIDLSQMNGGALQEKFNKAFEKVMQNLQDPNTPFNNKRVINIKFTFVQNEERDDVTVDIDVTERTESVRPWLK